MPPNSYDPIVIGVGGMGSAAVYQLAKRGVDVLGIEQYDIPHTRGSSHGDTRIFRLAQPDTPSTSPSHNGQVSSGANSRPNPAGPSSPRPGRFTPGRQRGRKSPTRYEDVLGMDEERFRAFAAGMRERGHFFSPNPYKRYHLSAVHTEADLER